MTLRYPGLLLRTAAAALGLLLFDPPSASAVTLSDPNFVYEVIYTGNGMITIAFGPGGRMYVCEKSGRVLVFRPNGSGGYLAPAVFLDISSSVDTTAETGLLGMALDPGFASNGYMYLFHSTTSDQRLIRVTADATYEAAVPGSTATLLTGFPRNFAYHKAGNIAFNPIDPNGLYITLGDDNDLDGSQDLNKFNGKLLRVNPANGQGLPDNPFQDGNMSSIRSRIWALGFRNPFRFAFHPNMPVADVLYSSENGNGTDRISFVRRGSNGNWNSNGDSGGFLSPADPNHKVMMTQSPFLIGITVVRGGPFADPAYPGSDALYVANGRTAGGSIGRWRLTGSNLDTPVAMSADNGGNFATGLMAVHIAIGPDNAMYFSESQTGASLNSNSKLARIRRVGGAPPVASFNMSPSSARGPAPFSVSFTDTSHDSDGTVSAWSWNFGDGFLSTAQNPTHVFSNPGFYTVTLDVTDNTGLHGTASAVVEAVHATTLNLSGTIRDGRNLSGSGLAVATELRLYQNDGVTPLAFPGGTGSAGNAIAVAAGGNISASVQAELAGNGVVITAGEGTAGFEYARSGFVVDSGATSWNLPLAYSLSDTAMRGRVLDTRSAAAVVDIGVSRGSPPAKYAVAGGRDYLASSGIPPSGVAHRVVSDALGYYYIPIPSGGAGNFVFDLVADTNAATYISRDVSQTIAADALIDTDITVGLVSGGRSCDTLAPVSSAPIDYDTQIQPIWDAQCGGCHNGSSGSNAGLNLSAGVSWTTLVNGPSSEVPGRALVEPGSPESSYLMEKVNCGDPQSGTRMRELDVMPVADQERVRNWIAQGAPPSPASSCGNGILEAGEQCDDGNTVSGDCCANCAFEPATTVCRASTNACDPAETCTGSSGTCPANGPPPDCSALSSTCTTGVCDPVSGCVANAANEGGTCNDANPATSNDRCTAGVCRGSDPDPSTPTLVNGQQISVALSSGSSAYYKIYVLSGATSFTGVMTGPPCGALGCGTSFTADLYVRRGARPSNGTYDCRPHASDSNETCSFTNPAEGWWYLRARDVNSSGTVQLTATHNGSGGANRPPVASFTQTSSFLTVNVDGTGSSDPDGNPLTYSWTFGDGATGSGSTASHTYAAGGTYTIQLTVNDGRGGSNTTSASVTVAPDPDPSTPTITMGQATSITLSATGSEDFRKVSVPAGRSSFVVSMTGPGCGLLGCSFNADLYLRPTARPSDTVYSCRSNHSNNSESCTMTSPMAGWWYIRVKSAAGSGTVTVTPTTP